MVGQYINRIDVIPSDSRIDVANPDGLNLAVYIPEGYPILVKVNTGEMDAEGNEIVLLHSEPSDYLPSSPVVDNPSTDDGSGSAPVVPGDRTPEGQTDGSGGGEDETRRTKRDVFSGDDDSTRKR